MATWNGYRDSMEACVWQPAGLVSTGVTSADLTGFWLAARHVQSDVSRYSWHCYLPLLGLRLLLAGFLAAGALVADLNLSNNVVPGSRCAS